jgi:SMODS-associated and fused to various effectors sensor domain
MSNDSTSASASGARLTGDDIQHAVAWHAALQTLVPNACVDGVTVEAIVHGNVDDVVIEKCGAPNEYTQVKATVSAGYPATIAWLTEVNRKRGSILQRFHASWQDLTKDGQRPPLNLVTNRSIDPEDPILTLRDRNDRLASRLRTSTKHATVSAIKELQAHLAMGEDELFDFLSDVRLQTDASEAAWRQRVREISFAAGVRADESAFRLGISEVREWVKSDRTQRRAADIAQAIQRLELSAEQPFTIVSINALESPAPLSGAGVVLDWVDRFRGTEARNRRGLKDTDDWPVLREELMAAQRGIRATGARRVLLTGTMRLPTWFAAGVAFQETAGFTVAKMKDAELWTRPRGPVPLADIEVSHAISDLPVGSDVALAIALSDDPTEDARQHLKIAHPDVPVVTVRPSSGVYPESISGLSHAFGLAISVRDLARNIARSVHPPVLHLFIAGPAGFAVLLGGVWDRVPSTQTYEDLAADGYEPAFFIPN